MKRLVIGTRGSRLALFQTELVRSALQSAYSDMVVEVEVIKTKGDKLLDLALDASGDKGLFTKELEVALLSGEIDMAVHSLKDMPVILPAGTMLGAILEREASEDVLLGSMPLSKLPSGAVVGTSSPRRVAQLHQLRPDLVFRPIRGNVQTRIDKMKRGEYDAIVMALAGIRRLGLEEEIAEVFPIDRVVSAPGQAAVAVQIREWDKELERLLRPLHCERTAREVGFERRILERLGGGCALPLGVRCIERADGIDLHAFYKSSQEAKPIYRYLYAALDDATVLEEQMLSQLSINVQ